MPNPAEIVPLDMVQQREFEEAWERVNEAQRIRDNPFAEIQRLKDRQAPLEEVVEMFRFYLNSRPGTILIATDDGAFDLREWVADKLDRAAGKEES